MYLFLEWIPEVYSVGSRISQTEAPTPELGRQHIFLAKLSGGSGGGYL